MVKTHRAKRGVVQQIPTPLDSAATTYPERYAAGRALRDKCPRAVHGKWKMPAHRPDPVTLILEAEKGRRPDLLPLRHGRMVRSPFTFYRAAALTMASDLASSPVTGIRVQCCGDAHLCNFGGFATPERRIIFSINDLDETLPAPWEWDLKRLATSFIVACRDNGMSDSAGKDVVANCVRSYRESMAEFSRMTTLDLWYHAMWAEDLLAGIREPELRERIIKRLEKERAKSRAEEMFPKLTETKGNFHVIKDQLPSIFHDEDFPPGQIEKALRDALAGYRATLPHSYQHLLDHYELRDIAIKVVGIGSVGTACWVALFMSGDNDPLFLQIKEARASVLEPYAGASKLSNHGQRVVNGYRILQPFSDVFLGWTAGPKGRHYFFRQLRDTKISARVETFGRLEMDCYSDWCGRALALSHARYGHSAVVSGYMGKGDALDQALATFAVSYADQNESDHAAFERAVRKGSVKAVLEQTA